MANDISFPPWTAKIICPERMQGKKQWVKQPVKNQTRDWLPEQEIKICLLRRANPLFEITWNLQLISLRDTKSAKLKAIKINSRQFSLSNLYNFYYCKNFSLVLSFFFFLKFQKVFRTNKIINLDIVLRNFWICENVF